MTFDIQKEKACFRIYANIPLKNGNIKRNINGEIVDLGL